MRSVLVTGASTGIGRATALRLDKAGWKVFAGVRKLADADALSAAASDRFVPLILDVTDAEQIAAAAERIGGELGDTGLNGLVNNAGAYLPSPLETMPIDDFRRQIEVNLTGQVAVTQAMLPAIRQARGRIVFISSIGGRLALPITGAYHATKFGIEAVGDVFRQELRPWGISVSIVEPGSIDTDIWHRAERASEEIGERAPAAHEALYGKALKGYSRSTKRIARLGIAPEKVAVRIEHALSASRPRTRYLVGLDAKAMLSAQRVLPTRAWDWIVARVIGL